MVCSSALSLVERDLNVIWHPFTQRKIDPLPLPFVSGRGVYLYTEKNEAYIDAISSWWVNLHGHAHPKIAQAIHEQSYLLDHVIFTDFTHLPAINLAEQLLKIMPSGFSKVFFSDNGSTAVEAALKMAIQYWFNQGIKKRKLLSLAGGYHGDTFGAMSVAGKNTFNLPFWPYLFEVISVDPFSEDCIDQLKEALDDDECTCFIYEPLVQGAAGMRFYPPARLEQMLSVCHEAGVLLIADEVMTGFGRTGPLFASSSLETKPDIICLSKGITGGFLPLGATICRQFIYETFLSERRIDAFLHGHSYTANPITCAAANASLELLLDPQCEKQREMVAHQHRSFCKKWQRHPALIRCETLGTILALEFKGQKGYTASIRDQLLRHFLSHKILLRPLGNVVYILPPYCVTQGELQTIYQAIEALL